MCNVTFSVFFFSKWRKQESGNFNAHTSFARKLGLAKFRHRKKNMAHARTQHMFTPANKYPAEVFGSISFRKNLATFSVRQILNALRIWIWMTTCCVQRPHANIYRTNLVNENNDHSCVDCSLRHH